MRPTVLLLDGDYRHTLQVAAELYQDLNATVIGVGSAAGSDLLRSRYCRIREVAPRPASPGYAEAILELVGKYLPDVVLPIGCGSVKAIDSIRSRIPEGVRYCLPASESLETALEKRRTLEVAERLGIPVPRDYTVALQAHAMVEDCTVPAGLPFPLFLKASREAGRNISARVDSPVQLWRALDELRQEAAHGDVLVQEYVAGDTHTYACGLLFMDGEPVLVYGHDEMRSVPRRGGSGTRLRVLRDPHLEEMSIRLLRELRWSGVALVEYKKRPDGTLVLMEVNPKFWASYALASRSGYRFASTMIGRLLGLPPSRNNNPQAKGEMVFPLREITYCLKERKTESILRGALAMVWPPAAWDLDLTDPATWLPYGVVHRLGRSLLRGNRSGRAGS